jgi:5-methylcytosine-specific restriction enzyme subunit McrC
MPKIMQVREYGILRIGEEQQGIVFEKRHWQQLFRYHDEHAAHRYYDMRHDGVRFRSYVGVIQASDLTIEILPKIDDIDDASSSDLRKWRNILLQMLKESGTLRMDSLGNAMLREKENSILDVYLELFITEVEALLHRGLVKRYRHTQGQQSALRGAIQFGKHIALNLVHQERFYTRHQSYDHQHVHNQLLRQALLLLPRLTTSPTLRGRAAQALLQWVETPAIKATASSFTRLNFDRKTEAYRPALVIARLLLLNHRPDLKGGSEDLIALLFNMNRLWEQYLLRTIQRVSAPHGWTVSKPSYKIFWSADDGSTSKMQPDILIEVPGKGNIVLDAKWKRPEGRPAEADLRQLYAYAHYYNAQHTILLYPFAAGERAAGGTFSHPDHLPAREVADLVTCSTLFVQVGSGHLGAPVEDFDASGYLRCSLSDQLTEWLLNQNIG